MADTVRGVGALQQELARANESLKDVDEKIKKLTGRDPTESRPGQQRPGQRRVSTGGPPAFRGGRGEGQPFRGGRGDVQERLFNLARRGIQEERGPPGAKRRAVGGAFSRLGPMIQREPRPVRPDSGDEEELPHKPTVQSSVVATPKETKTRKDHIDEQSKDERGKARNRRMFGLLLGTLQKFQDEAKVKNDREKRRKEIEQKLEEKAVEEREQLKKERQTLFNERRQKQAKLRKLEAKMELVKSHEEWEKQTKKLNHFIRTKTTPHIFYLPRTHTPATEKKLKESINTISDIINERRQGLEREIDELTRNDEEDKIFDDADEHGDEEDRDEPMETAEADKQTEDSREIQIKRPSGGDDKENHGSGGRDSLTGNQDEAGKEDQGEEDPGKGESWDRDEGHKERGRNKKHRRRTTSEGSKSEKLGDEDKQKDHHDIQKDREEVEDKGKIETTDSVPGTADNDDHRKVITAEIPEPMEDE